MGSRTERLLVETIREADYAAVKTDLGGHGGFKTGSDAGDIIAGQEQRAWPWPRTAPEDVRTYSNLYIIEEKYKSTEANRYLQEDGEKAEAMIEFSELIGATPMFAVRWSSNLDWSLGANHRVIDAREVDTTKAGNYSISPSDAEDWPTAEEYFDA